MVTAFLCNLYWKNWAAYQPHHIWWAAWRLQTHTSFFCEVLEAPASPGHLLPCFVLWGSFCCPWSLKVQPSIYLGLSFELLSWFCIHLSLKLVLSKTEYNFMYFRCLQTTAGVTEMWTADCTVSVCIFMPCCWLLLVFVLSLECVLAFMVHPVTFCTNYLVCTVPKARIHSKQWQSTKFLPLYNQNYVKKALFVKNNMQAGTDMRYVHSQLRTTQGWNIFSKALKWGSCNAVVCRRWKTTIFSWQWAEKISSMTGHLPVSSSDRKSTWESCTLRHNIS